MTNLPPMKKSKYILPEDPKITYNAEKYFSCPPNSKMWIHDIQTDDSLDDNTKRRTAIIAKLKQVKIPQQRSAEWFKQRSQMITASDIGTALGENEHEHQFNVILKKLIDVPFTGEKACYHGKKYENIAAMIYGYRMNVSLAEYGCIEDECGFIGASPDRIIDVYKLDGVHKTNLVGKMVEIKCTATRKINMTSNNIHDIVPDYYYPQPQIQMQCCDLDSCDFWQCNIKEYKNRQDFIDDTDAHEPFRSKQTGFEKGVIIQLVPMFSTGKSKDSIIYSHTKFIYPTSIEMTPNQCDRWVANVISTFREIGKESEEYTSSFQDNDDVGNYTIDSVIYWKLVEARSVTIKRDRKWFATNFPILERLWDYVKFLRANPVQKELFINYAKFAKEHFTEGSMNEKVMDTMAKLFNTRSKNYKKILVDIQNEMNVVKQTNNDFDGYEICD